MGTKKDLSAALSQRKNVPPLQRGKGIQLSSDEAKEQDREVIDLQKSETKTEQQNEEAHLQIQETVNMQPSDSKNSQLRKDADCDISQFSDGAQLLKNGKASPQISKNVEQQENKIVMQQESTSAIVEKS